MESMPVVHARCCGIDVHKETVVACVRRVGPAGNASNEVRTFATTTRGLLVKDCQWIAQLLSAGLLSPSFVPERPQRDLRDLTRQRVQLIQDKNADQNSATDRGLVRRRDRASSVHAQSAAGAGGVYRAAN